MTEPRRFQSPQGRLTRYRLTNDDVKSFGRQTVEGQYIPPVKPLSEMETAQQPGWSMGEEICNRHPSRQLEWDGYGLVCPGCVLGHPSEETTDNQARYVHELLHWDTVLSMGRPTHLPCGCP